MSKQAMDYIIEKMRGDSLTPLGTGRKDNPSPDNDAIISLLASGSDGGSKAHEILDKALSSGHTFLYGKWVLVEDPSLKYFFRGGFYYKVRVANGRFVYLFCSHRALTSPNRLDLYLSTSFTSSSRTSYYDSDILISCDRSNITPVSSFLSKGFGIKTFDDDYKKFYVRK